MGVWTSVEVQYTIVRMRVSRRLKSGPVRPSTWHGLKVWTIVEVQVQVLSCAMHGTAWWC